MNRLNLLPQGINPYAIQMLNSMSQKTAYQYLGMYNQYQYMNNMMQANLYLNTMRLANLMNSPENPLNLLPKPLPINAEKHAKSIDQIQQNNPTR